MKERNSFCLELLIVQLLVQFETIDNEFVESEQNFLWHNQFCRWLVQLLKGFVAAKYPGKVGVCWRL